MLAPELSACHVVALDAAGHGRSGHRSADASYDIWDDLSDILEVSDALGWSRFSLLGHSRGAAVATLFAGTFPDRVSNLMLIEGGLPILGKAEDAPANLANALAAKRRLHGEGGRVFPSRARAIAERVDGFSPVTEAAAEILARRSLLEVEGGWQWQGDRRLKAGSELRLTRELVRPFLERIEARSTCVMARESPFADLDDYRDLLRLIPGIEVVRLPGRHHLHLEGGEADIAAHLNRFLSSA